MKKIFIILLFIIILSSCHGKLVSKNYGKLIYTDFVVPEEFDESKTYNLTFWAKNDSNKFQQQIYNNAISEFEKIYPNININIVQYNDYTKIYNDVIKNIATKTTPNISIAYPDHVAAYAIGENVVVPLDNLISDENYGLGGEKIKFSAPKKEDYIEKFLNEGIIQEHYWTMPFMRSSEALYVNKTYLLENGFEIPEVFTWDYIWEVCDYALKKAKLENKVMLPLIYKSTDNMFIQLLKQYNFDYTSENGEVFFLKDDICDMLLNLSEVIDNGYLETFSRVSYPGNYFNRAQCIFMIDSTAGSTWVGSEAPLLDIPASEVVDFETEVFMIPQVDTSNPSMISQGPSICLFAKEDRQEVLASWIFIQYLLTNNVQIPYSQTEGYVPVTKLATNSTSYQDYLKDESQYDVKIKSTELVLNNIDNTFITPVFNGSSLCRSASGYLIEAMFSTKYRDKNSVFDLFDVVNKRYKLSTYVIR